MQVPGLADDLPGGGSGGVDLTHVQAGGGLDGGALGAGTGMRGLAEAN
ncbi:MAG TPA: hypothetical protein VMV92_16655 [Streptosporangiaceae bacterium]|nr:hypothetical protein [Streptosporangiaceae bacterium]